MTKVWFSSVAIRVLILCFWSSLILLFLYIPQIAYWFQDQKTISLLAWSKDIDRQIIASFEKETGIRVNVSYFEDYEEMFVKLRATKGQGYDVVFPSDYIVPLLIKEGLLQKLDKTKLSFWKQIQPALLGKYYDSTNDYTIPFFWSIFGLGVDKDHFGGKVPPASWRLIFDEHITPGNIGMPHDAREISLIAAKYLFGSIESLNEEKIKRITELLLQQKKWVTMYTDTRADFLLASKTCPIVLTLSDEIARVMRRYPNIAFLIPEEGSFIVIDNIAIPIQSSKTNFVYQFINYIYRADVQKKYIEKHLHLSPLEGVTPEELIAILLIPSEEQLGKAEFFKDVIKDNQLNEIWISLKA